MMKSDPYVPLQLRVLETKGICLFLSGEKKTQGWHIDFPTLGSNAWMYNHIQLVLLCDPDKTALSSSVFIEWNLCRIVEYNEQVLLAA